MQNGIYFGSEKRLLLVSLENISNLKEKEIFVHISGSGTKVSITWDGLDVKCF